MNDVRIMKVAIMNEERIINVKQVYLNKCNWWIKYNDIENNLVEKKYNSN